jgi:hypothetical protein
MQGYPWIDISPDPMIGLAMGAIVAFVLVIAAAAHLVASARASRRWDAADRQADLRDQLEAMRRVGVSPGVRYALALREGLRPETAEERRWVEALRSVRLARLGRVNARLGRLISRAEAAIRAAK